MKFIPHEDNWEREYFDKLKDERKKKIANKKRRLGCQKKKKQQKDK
jgi:ribosomal protein S21